MNLVDAVCAQCGTPIHWLSGTARLCLRCFSNQGVVDKEFIPNIPAQNLSPREQSELYSRFQALCDRKEKLGPEDSQSV